MCQQNEDVSNRGAGRSAVLTGYRKGEKQLTAHRCAYCAPPTSKDQFSFPTSTKLMTIFAGQFEALMQAIGK